MDTLNTAENIEIEKSRKLSQSEFQEKISHSTMTNLNYDYRNINYHIDEYDPIASQSAICLEDKISKNSITGENILIELFKRDQMMNLEEKLNLARIVLSYFTNYATFEDFYEEECHLAMVNWIYKSKNYLESENLIHSQIYDLINIILNIFELLPIKVEDLFSLNIYEKLNKIRKIMKNKNFIIYQKLDRLLCYWSQFCIDESMLNKKKERIEFDYEEMKEMESLNRKKACLIGNFGHGNKTRWEFVSQNVERNCYAKSSVYDSGILKTTQDMKKEKKIKKSVQWKKEDEINQVNIFKYFDPPAAGAITQDEYESINSFIKEIRSRNSDINLEVNTELIES